MLQKTPDLSAQSLASIAPRQIPSLTSLRFVAAFMVMFGHMFGQVYSGIDQTTPAFRALQNFAQVGMSLFFVLSGYVISYNYTSIGSLRKADIKRFSIARFARIYPAYILVLLLNAWIWSWSDVTPLGLLAHLSLTQDWFMHTVNGIPLISQFHNAAVMWSISAEWFCYLLFPLICFTLDRVTRPVVGAALVWVANLGWMYWVSVMGSHYLISGNVHGYKLYEWLGYYSPFVRLFEFVIGCLAFRIGSRLSEPGLTEQKLSPLFASTSVVWLVGALIVFNLSGMWFFFGWCGGYTPGAALLIFCCGRYGGSILKSRWLVLSGDASYSFYLLHTIVTYAMLRLVPLPTNNVFFAAITIVGTIAVNLLVSIALYKSFESPARVAIRHFFSSKQFVDGSAPVTT